MAKEKGPSKAEVYKWLCELLNREETCSLPPLEKRFHVLEPNPGIKTVLEEHEQGLVRHVDELAVVNALVAWCKKYSDGMSFYRLTFAECKQAMEYWKAQALPIEQPAMVRWPGENGLTFRRLPWSLRVGDTPLFDELFSRCSNGHAFMMFIGSLFFPESNCQQYVWLHGKGDNGKGALSRFLFRLLGDAYTSQETPGKEDKFWTSGLLGKRLAVFPDCNNTSFVAGGRFKGLTGGDPIRIEMKGKQPYTVRLHCKYLFLSNEKPSLSSEKADMRRAIFSEMTARTAPDDHNYEKKLWDEGGAFISKCLEAYQKGCGNGLPIPIDAGSAQDLDDWVSTLEEGFEEVFARNFRLDEEDTKVKLVNSYVLPSAMMDRLEVVFKNDRKSQMEFRSWLDRKHGIRKKSKKVKLEDGKEEVIKVYPAIELIVTGEDVRLAEKSQLDLQKEFERVRRRQKTASRLAGSRLKALDSLVVDIVDT